MNQRTLSIAAALTLSGALLAASPASADRVAQIERDVTNVVAQAPKMSPRVAERMAPTVTTVGSTTTSPRVAERTAQSATTTSSTTTSPRVAERQGRSDPSDDVLVRPHQGQHGHW